MKSIFTMLLFLSLALISCGKGKQSAISSKTGNGGQVAEATPSIKRVEVGDHFQFTGLKDFEGVTITITNLKSEQPP